MAGRVAPEASRLASLREAVVFLWQTDRRWRATLGAAVLTTVLVVALPPSERGAPGPSRAPPASPAAPLETGSPAASADPVPAPGAVERLKPAAPLEGGAIVVDPDEGFAPGTKWEEIPEDWVCPDCGVGKEDFEMVEI